MIVSRTIRDLVEIVIDVSPCEVVKLRTHFVFEDTCADNAQRLRQSEIPRFLPLLSEGPSPTSIDYRVRSTLGDIFDQSAIYLLQLANEDTVSPFGIPPLALIMAAHPSRYGRDHLRDVTPT